VRISTKLALGLSLVSGCILGGYGYWQYQQEEYDLRLAAERDFRMLGVAVRVAVENSLRDKQTADLHEILDSLEVREPDLDVVVVDPRGELTAHSLDQEQSDESARAWLAGLDVSAHVAHRDADPVVWFDGPNGRLRLIGVYPLWKDGNVNGLELGTMVIARPLEALQIDLDRTFDSAVVSSLTLIGGITLVGWLLILLYVRRPLEQLGMGMRTVRDGDLSAMLPPRSSDELGAIAVEFNTMTRELAQARQQLLHAAESREALEQSLMHLDKLATVGQLSAGLAHEIGSPLQILSGRAHALTVRTDVPSDVVRTGSIMEEQSNRITAIVQQLLGFARRRTPHMTDVDPGPPIAQIVDLLDGESRRRGVQLELRCPAALPRVTADPDQIQQVAMNLLSNALRATPRGGRVHVSLAQSVFTTADGMYEQPSVALTVEDSGTGIPEPLRGRIFEPFFTTWTASGGTGLGLAVVKAIVDDHGGAIVVTPHADCGTTFVVHFPAAGSARRGVFVA
jgi:signal transduction histidine kinase